MQHYKDPLPGATWSPKHFGNAYNRFVDQLVEKINSGMKSGKIFPLTPLMQSLCLDNLRSMARKLDSYWMQ